MTIPAPAGMHSAAPNTFKFAATLVIDYFRWTQLSPLITIWAFALAMLAVMLFVNNVATHIP